MWRAELIRCPQFPTTLPTLDELIGTDGITEGNVAAHLLERTKDATTGHVYLGYNAGANATVNVNSTTTLRVAAFKAGSGYELYAVAATVIGGTSLIGGQGGIPGPDGDREDTAEQDRQSEPAKHGTATLFR